ncbi:hypothetical protein [Longispora albida]|uniref:hypothetical protein n=1 Tax=Longispora albida TaxID=203523 RepID=UPI00036B809B|nr:hypothetical protein [Longispora albida]
MDSTTSNDPLRGAALAHHPIVWSGNVTRGWFSREENAYILPDTCDTVRTRDAIAYAKARVELMGSKLPSLHRHIARRASASLISIETLAVAMVSCDGLTAQAQALGVLPSTLTDRIDTLTLPERHKLTRLIEQYRTDCGGRVWELRRRLLVVSPQDLAS